MNKAFDRAIAMLEAAGATIETLQFPALDRIPASNQFAAAVLPAQRTKFSKRQFSQPQLLAVLYLMRYEDRTFREAEVRLSEHAELRAALRLTSVPDHTTLYRFLTRRA